MWAVDSLRNNYANNTIRSQESGLDIAGIPSIGFFRRQFVKILNFDLISIMCDLVLSSNVV